MSMKLLFTGTYRERELVLQDFKSRASAVIHGGDWLVKTILIAFILGVWHQ